MRAELVDGADVESALNEWETLYAADPDATPFVSPGWARAWMTYWAPEATPWLLRVRDGDRIAGLMPLAIRRRGPIRLLGMLGQEPGDYWDVVAAPGDRQAASAAAAEELARRSGEWDAGILSCIPPGSKIRDALVGAGLRILDRADVPCPAITLPATFEDYLASLPRSRRGNVRRHLRRLDMRTVERVEIRNADQLPAALACCQDLHLAQWDQRGRVAEPAHRTERFRAFLLHAVQALAPSGQALVWELRVDGKTAGMYVNFADDRSFYWYHGGFDPAHARMGIGKIAIIAGIRDSIEHGRERYDFTRGAEPYKYWFGAHDRLASSLVIGTSGVRSRAVLAGAARINARRERAVSSAVEPQRAPQQAR
jgi:CelD/BcsL family acetyltransferase involved in cellulose biosynthesis